MRDNVHQRVKATDKSFVELRRYYTFIFGPRRLNASNGPVRIWRVTRRAHFFTALKKSILQRLKLVSICARKKKENVIPRTVMQCYHRTWTWRVWVCHDLLTRHTYEEVFEKNKRIFSPDAVSGVISYIIRFPNAILLLFRSPFSRYYFSIAIYSTTLFSGEWTHS